MIPLSRIIRDVAICIVVIGLSTLILYIGFAHGSRAKAQELIQVYEEGKRDALRLLPPSMDLEMVCLSLWANTVPVPENLHK
jgi:hypothetical protein